MSIIFIAIKFFFQANYKQVINEMLLLACQAVKNYLHALVENVGFYLNRHNLSSVLSKRLYWLFL